MKYQAFYVDCPWCKVPTVVIFNEFIPAVNNQCMALCDQCHGSFRLLSADYCKTCPELSFCISIPSVNLLEILCLEKVLRLNPSGTRAVLCQ